MCFAGCLIRRVSLRETRWVPPDSRNRRRENRGGPPGRAVQERLGEALRPLRGGLQSGRRVAGGEWRVASGGWRVAGGEWRVASSGASREPPWLLLGNIFPIVAYCGLVVETQPLNC